MLAVGSDGRQVSYDMQRSEPRLTDGLTAALGLYMEKVAEHDIETISRSVCQDRMPRKWDLL